MSGSDIVVAAVSGVAAAVLTALVAVWIARKNPRIGDSGCKSRFSKGNMSRTGLVSVTRVRTCVDGWTALTRWCSFWWSHQCRRGLTRPLRTRTREPTH